MTGGAGWATVRGDDEGWRVMGRRTAWWHGGRPLAIVATVLCATAALPGRPAAAAETATPKPYAFAQDATTVQGATGTTDAVRLEPGGTYRSSLGKDGKLYYRLELDATSNAYIAATAVPRPGTKVAYSDGVKVSVQDGNSGSCSSSTTAHFGASQSPHPIAAWASREIGPGKYACQAAGTYYVVVERTAAPVSSASPPSSPDAWDLELSYVLEPRLKKAGSTSAPETWNSASPEALQGDARPRRGGAGFTTAGALEQGVWKDGISPGQTLFYKVPVDWGQQFYATAELGSSSGGEGFMGTALVVSLYNPVRGLVTDVGAGYDGSQRSAALDPLPPVEYDNRYAFNDRTSGMRFAGSYYLVVHLAAQVADKFGAGPFGLTLRVRVDGAAQTGPAYVGRAVPQDVFDSATGDSVPATGGMAPAGSGGSDDATTMKLVAVGGIGTGTVLVLALGLWTVAARRRSTPRGW
ncbi:hypothetical protein ABT030_38555 [Streptomyces mirabilis]